MAKEQDDDVISTIKILFSKVSKADLDKVRAEIKKGEEEIAKWYELERVLAKMLKEDPLSDPRESVKKKWMKKVKEPGEPGADDDPAPTPEEAMLEKRKRVAVYVADGGLTGRNGQEIIRQCKVQPAQLVSVMTHVWFSKSVSGYYSITPQAKRDIPGLGVSA